MLLVVQRILLLNSLIPLKMVGRGDH